MSETQGGDDGRFREPCSETTSIYKHGNRRCGVSHGEGRRDRGEAEGGAEDVKKEGGGVEGGEGGG